MVRRRKERKEERREEHLMLVQGGLGHCLLSIRLGALGREISDGGGQTSLLLLLVCPHPKRGSTMRKKTMTREGRREGEKQRGGRDGGRDEGRGRSSDKYSFAAPALLATIARPSSTNLISLIIAT